jgi:hypothetical protein
VQYTTSHRALGARCYRPPAVLPGAVTTLVLYIYIAERIRKRIFCRARGPIGVEEADDARALAVYK